MRTLVVQGDSLSAFPAFWAPGTMWPELIAQRTGAIVTSLAEGGTGSQSMMNRTSALLGGVPDGTDPKPIHTIWGAVNDTRINCGCNPKYVARRLVEIASRARGKGYNSYCITTTPVPAYPFPTECEPLRAPMYREEWRLEQNRWIKIKAEARGIPVLDVGELFTFEQWCEMNDNDAHPINLECRQQIADFIQQGLGL